MKASFSKGFANEKLAEGRSPMVAKLDTGDTVVEFEMSFRKDRSWKLYHFLIALANDDVSPKEAFLEAFEGKENEA